MIRYRTLKALHFTLQETVPGSYFPTRKA